MADRRPAPEAPTDEQGAQDFFVATRESYRAPAGAVLALTPDDWENKHRRRHLDNFAQSTVKWKAEGVEQKSRILKEGPRLMAEALCHWEERGNKPILDRSGLDQAFVKLRKELKCMPPIADVVRAYRALPAETRNPVVQTLLQNKPVRSASGVSVITVLTAPGEFSCAFDCAYCPNEPGQPRSYLSTEPAVMRANQNGWDACDQFWDRATTLHDNGHTVDKLEVLVLGGTWSGYPEDYQEMFIRDLFYAANVLPAVLENRYNERPMTEGLRSRKTLKDEQLINEFTKEFANEKDDYMSWQRIPRIIGLTLETRPDQITPREIHRLRYLGTTRVQMGVQHTDDAILEHIRRKCPISVTKKALALLKNACFKVDIHLMPDLPRATPDIDRRMFEQVLSDPALQADQWKIYPCEVTPFSSIEGWYTEPEKHPEDHYIPYADEDGGRVLVNVLAAAKRAVHPWIRLNRVIRDIPECTIIGGNNRTNLRQILDDIMGSCDWSCRCMRCREVRDKEVDPADAELKIRRYQGDHGCHEYFISYESQDEKTLFAFLRLRIRNGKKEPSTMPRPSSSPDAYWHKLNPASRMGQSFMDDQLVEAAAKKARHKQILSKNREKSREQTSARNRLEGDAQHKDYDIEYDVFPELGSDVALIRELHTYGQIVAKGESKNSANDLRAQHRGFGRMLLGIADRLAAYHSCRGLAVISGVGVRGYYRKFDFKYAHLGDRCGAACATEADPCGACVANMRTEPAEPAYIPAPGQFNMDNPLGDSQENAYRARGEFLMKFVPSFDKLQSIREDLGLPEELIIQNFDCSTKLPNLDGYDLELASKQKREWDKKLRDLKKRMGGTKKNVQKKQTISASITEHLSQPLPEYGSPEFDERYHNGSIQLADEIFSHAASTHTIQWDRHEKESDGYLEWMMGLGVGAYIQVSEGIAAYPVEAAIGGAIGIAALGALVWRRNAN